MTAPDGTPPGSVGERQDDGESDTRAYAQFFFEVGYTACWAESYTSNGSAPFSLTNGIIDHAWEIAGEAHDDPDEFARKKALSDAAPDLLAALTRIAAFDDEYGNARLTATGSYSAFDEPAAVETARAAIAKATS